MAIRRSPGVSLRLFLELDGASSDDGSGRRADGFPHDS